MSPEFELNWLDLTIVLIIVGSTGISLWRGFGREALSLLNFFMAFTIARLFSPQLSGLLMGSIENDSIRNVVAFVGLVIISLFVGGLITRLVSRLIQFSSLEVMDRILGAFFGAARGILIVLVVVGSVNWGGWFERTKTWESSNFLPTVLEVEMWSRQLVRIFLFKNDMDGLNDPLKAKLQMLRGVF